MNRPKAEVEVGTMKVELVLKAIEACEPIYKLECFVCKLFTTIQSYSRFFKWWVLPEKVSHVKFGFLCLCFVYLFFNVLVFPVHLNVLK